MCLVMHPRLDAGVWQTAGCSQQHLCCHFHCSSLQGSLLHITRGLKVPFLLPRVRGKRRSCQLTRQGNCFAFMQQTDAGLSITPPVTLTCLPRAAPHPLHQAGLQTGLSNQVFFFCATIKWHTASSQWSRCSQKFTLTELTNSTKIIPQYTFFC